LIWKLARQDAKIKGERGKKKEMVDGAKPELPFLCMPPLHGKNTETILKMPWNGIFSCQNQLHALFKDDEAVDTCSTNFFKYI
jgi:hypothetical protein